MFSSSLIQSYAPLGHPNVLTVSSLWCGKIENTTDGELTIVTGWLPGTEHVIKLMPGESYEQF